MLLHEHISVGAYSSVGGLTTFCKIYVTLMQESGTYFKSEFENNSPIPKMCNITYNTILCWHSVASKSTSDETLTQIQYMSILFQKIRNF